MKKRKINQYHELYFSNEKIVLPLLLFPTFAPLIRILVEGAMVCLIYPTATTGAVVTQKLGGNAAHLTTYTI